MRKNKWKGKLIVIEGLDAAGKTTAIKKVAGKFTDKGVRYLKGVCRDNALGYMAKYFATTWLFSLELLWTTWFPLRRNLKKGKHVLADKYCFSIFSHVPETNTAFNRAIIKLLKPLMIQPDMVIYFHLSSDERIRRLKKQPYNKFHQRLIDNPGLIAAREQANIALCRRSGEKFTLLDLTGFSPELTAKSLETRVEFFLSKEGAFYER